MDDVVTRQDVARSSKLSSPSGPTQSKRSLPLKLLGGSLFGAWAVIILNFIAHANSPGYPTDDGYIAFSYARTLANHGTLTLTPGAPRVQGFSDALWVAMLAMLHLVGLSVPTAARLVSTACVMALVPATYLLARRLSPLTPRLFAGIVAASAGVLPGGIFFALSGLETSLATLLLTVALADLVRPDLEARPPFVAIASMLGFCLLRPEGFVLWAAVTVARFLTLRPIRLGGSKRLLGYWFGLFLAPLALYEVFDVLYFGTLVPNTVTAKLGSPAYDTVVAAFHYFGSLTGPLVIFVALAAFGILRRRSVVVIVTTLVVLAGLTVGSAVQDGYPYQRYIFVGVPALLALSASGAGRIAVFVKERRPRAGGAITVALVVVLALGVQLEFANSPLVSSSQLTSLTAIGPTWRSLFAADNGPHNTVYPGYHSVSRWLTAKAHPGQMVALEEIGIVSYYSGLRILDTFGLADKVIAHYPGRPAYRADPQYVFRQRPDYFVMPLVPGVGSLIPALPGDSRYARTPTFAFGYDLAGTFPEVQKFDAVFVRQPGLVSVASLDARLPHSQVVVAPSSLGALADAAHPGPAAVTAARYWLRGNAVGATGTQQKDGSYVTRLSFTVPSTGVSRFAIGTGPVMNANSTSWHVQVNGPTGVPLGIGRTTTTGSDWNPLDLSIPLNAWRGERVEVTLSYSDRSGAGRQQVPKFVEPRIVTAR